MLLLLACVLTKLTDDTAGDDTGAPPTPDLDHAWEAYGCQWAYTAGLAADGAFALSLDLPEADLAAEVDVSYSRPLGATERFVLWDGGPGGDTVALFDCGDLMEDYGPGRVWTATSATVSLDAAWDHEEPGNECTGSAPNYFYTGTFSLLGATLVDGDGAVATVDFGPWTATVGWNGCGG